MQLFDDATNRRLIFGRQAETRQHGMGRLKGRQLFRRDPSVLLNTGQHRQPREVRGQINFLVLVSELLTAVHRPADKPVHTFNERHHVVEAGVGRVNLHHRKLRRMPGRNAFVAEDPPDFVHFIKAADNQPLQVKLQRDPQMQF